mgnify:CR=1 FL=1|tara:strand:- start:110 stop:706 length:597 start_codon:yes stop_codon:yes gene_type:complete
MNKQVVIFVNLTELYNILYEIKNFISFDIKNYANKDDFFQDLNKNNILTESTIVTNSIEYFKWDNKNLDKRNILVFKDFPIQIGTIVDQINIQLIKQRYDFQSKININNYNLNLNSRKISKDKKDLKLTEREIDIILFLKKQKEPKTIEILQKEIWHYSSDLETHTVETHIYRLRKKIKDQFNDKNFIVSHKEGYSIK